MKIRVNERGKAMSDKLLQFKVALKDSVHEFAFYGSYEKAEINSFFGDKKFPVIEEDSQSIRLMELVDGKEIPYQVRAKTWSGHRLDEVDAFIQTWTSLTMDTVRPIYEFSFIDPGIQEVVDAYKQTIIIDASGREFQKYCLYNDEYDVCELSVVTEDSAFYTKGDCGTVFVGLKRGEVLADNYFAEAGLCEVLENADEGKLMLLYRNDKIVGGEANKDAVEVERPKEQKAYTKEGETKGKKNERKASVLAKLKEKQNQIKSIKGNTPHKKQEQEL